MRFKKSVKYFFQYYFTFNKYARVNRREEIFYQFVAINGLLNSLFLIIRTLYICRLNFSNSLNILLLLFQIDNIDTCVNLFI